MKTVFGNSELAHIYAQQSQDYGRSQSMSFSRNKIYSYNQCIGQIKGNTIFLIDWNYSNTTAKHNNYVSRSTSHYNTVLLYDPEYPNSEANINSILHDIEVHTKKLARARKPSIYINSINYLQNKARNLYNALIECNLPLSSEVDQLYHDCFDIIIDENYINKAKEDRKAEEEEEAKRNAWKLQKLEANIIEFRNFESNSVYNNLDYNTAYLRVNNSTKELETSKGVKVQLSKAKFLFNMYKKVLSGEIDKRKLENHKIDYYTINNVDKKGVKIGCHYITKDELFNVLENL